MKILGFLKDPLFYLRILATSSVLSTGLLIRSQVNNTSDASISGKNESLRVVREESHQRAIGRDIMDLVPNSRMTSNYWEKNLSPERSYPYIHPSERPITRRPDNCLFMKF